MSIAALLIITLVVRGIGSGIIFGIGILINPVRAKIGISEYSKFIKIFYKGLGVKAYAIITGLGAILTVTLLAMTTRQELSLSVIAFLAISLSATALGFVGTAGAFPTMNILWRTSDEDEERVKELLNKFEFWHWFSAIAHLVAFFALAIALSFLIQ